VRLKFTLFFIILFSSVVVRSQCTLANYLSAIRIPIASYPYAATSAAVTVSANATGVPTLGNSSYSCGGNLYGGASPAWWLNAATQTISLVFSQPVTSLTFLINGTNSTEVFYIVSSSTCALSISNLCSVGYTSVGGTVTAGPTAGLGSLITVNNPGGSTQYRMTHNGLGAGSRVTLLDCFVLGSGTCVLPIELSAFTGKCKNNIVDLEWETITERNNDFFAIERSKDGFDWEEIGHVKGAGNSASPKYYSFTDPKPNNSILYYRLRQTDYNGEFNTSKLITVNSCQQRSDVVVYPNPASDEVIISGWNNESIELHDVYGSEIINKTIQTEEDLKIDISELQKGVYFLKVNGKTHKVVKE
jgi:hypothetical protein